MRRRWIALAVLVSAAGWVAPVGPSAFAGVDADAKADVFFANVETNRVCLGDGSGGFVCGDVGTSSDVTIRVDAGDLNDDGFVDAVFVNPNGTNQVCLSDGLGDFVCRDVNTETGFATVALGHFDGDRNLDAVFGGHERTSRMCSGDGSGVFICSNVSGDVYATNDMAAGDVNNDGDLDVVFANVNNQRDRVCLGDGSGGFSCSDVSSDTGGTADVALGDANNDGNLDAIFATGAGRLCLGNGSGTFICDDIGLSAGDVGAVAVGDINEDGNLDAVFGMGGRNQLCLGNGSGGFACGDMNTDTDATPGIAAADLNRDGHVDVILANDGTPNQACLGDGAGHFTCNNISGDANKSLDVAVAPARQFADTNGNTFENDIEWLAGEGITKGCNPPVNDLFCPDDFVSRGQMAAFLVRALNYTDNGGGDLFTDDDGNTFENDIDKLATAGVTKGCNPPANNQYCPDDLVTRGHMAAFLHRALDN